MHVPVLRQADRMVPRRSHVRQAARLARIPQKWVPVLRSEYAKDQCALRHLRRDRSGSILIESIRSSFPSPLPMGEVNRNRSTPLALSLAFAAETDDVLC